MDLFLTKPIFKDTVSKLLIKFNLVKWVSKPVWSGLYLQIKFKKFHKTLKSFKNNKKTQKFEQIRVQAWIGEAQQAFRE